MPPAADQIEATIAEQLPSLRPAQRHGLARWVYGAILARRAGERAVVAALAALGRWQSLRQYLRAWRSDGADQAAPCRTPVDVTACFAPLLRWVVRWWQGTELALAVDATAHGDRVVALVVSVLYRGHALPVAWAILPANRAGAWIPPFLDLLDRLGPAVPAGWTVLVLADRGLWSPRLWRGIRGHGWHPVLRLRQGTLFRPVGGRRPRADRLVPGPGHAWVGRGPACRDRAARRRGTLIVRWGEGHAAPWVCLTDLAPTRVGPCWDGLRIWVELGFRALKGVGWRWAHTRRTDPDRVARHWLVLAVATRWALAVGTRADDAAAAGVAPGRLRAPRPAPDPIPRRVSVFRQGLAWLHWQIRARRLWHRRWLAPEPWPQPPPGLVLHRHHPPRRATSP